MDDGISSLPDELLCHILSFLPTQQAVATSVLSKRWRPLWLSVPVLDYDNKTSLWNGKPLYYFERVMYATIFARDAQQPITTLRLKYKFHDHERANVDVNVWVNTAIQRGIENLELEPEKHMYHLISLSCSIFTCRTLVVLKLEQVSLAASSSVELPSLKSLHLKRVKFEEAQYLIELLYGCPMLEDLKAYNPRYAHYAPTCKERFKNFYSPKLVRADLRFLGMEILPKAMLNVEFLTITEVGVYGVGIEFFHLRHLAVSLTMIINSDWLFLILKNCPKLQSFEFGGYFEAEGVLPCPHFVPECLTSCLTKCYFKCYLGTETGLQFAEYIMQNSTYLQSMKICGGVSLNPLEVMKKLASCPRKCASCELSFDDTYDLYVSRCERSVDDNECHFLK